MLMISVCHVWCILQNVWKGLQILSGGGIMGILEELLFESLQVCVDHEFYEVFEAGLWFPA